MRVVLISMNDIGRYALEALAETPGVEVAALFTVRERGKHFMDVTDFTDLAERFLIPVIKVGSINDPEAETLLRALAPDYCFTLGWKQIVKEHLLAIPTQGWIGGHPAYLLLQDETPDPTVLSAPGNEPLQYAILGGYQKTGMTLFWVKAKIDAGEVFARGEVELDVEHETAYTLVQKIGQVTGDLLRANLPALLNGTPPRLPQELENIQPYMKPIRADDVRIDPNAPVEETYRLIRSVVYPYPNAYLEFHGQRIYVSRARLENGVFTELLVRAGGSPWEH
ncbi:MAG: methionyl-tRNA formyltransferase [Armatimonadota bacterium]